MLGWIGDIFVEIYDFIVEVFARILGFLGL